MALAEVEAVGVRIDKTYLEHAILDCDRRIREHEHELRSDPAYRIWHRRFGDSTKVSSPEQLAAVVFGDMGYKAKKQTASGKRDSADESSFVGITEPIVQHYFAAAKLRKGRDTYLTGIQREMIQHSDDGLWYVHPNYNLNTVATFRSSSDSPNFQNQPNRNQELADIVRRCYIPRPGRQIIEIDYAQQEVRTMCCYTHDPNLIKYVCDPDSDMHRDMAMKLFFLDAKQAKQKDIRFIAKNQVVFALFYGSYYKQCAPLVWQEMQDIKINETGTPLVDHLRQNGITECGDCDPESDAEPARHTFERHLRDIERDFWQNQFPVYAQWKRNWVDSYYRDGGCRFLSGFVMTGPHKKNEILSYANQGLGFHCLLWSLIQKTKAFRRYKMASRVIGEIHDADQIDVLPSERNAVIDLSVDIMTEKIKKWAPWLVVPLGAEPEACPVDGPWFCKSALVKASDGQWVPGDMAKWTEQYGAWE